MPIGCTLKYLARGVASTRESRQDLNRELRDAVNHAGTITVLPVVDGLSIDLEIDDIAPFSELSIEPYIAEQVLPECIHIACRPAEPAQLQLLKSRFY